MILVHVFQRHLTSQNPAGDLAMVFHLGHALAHLLVKGGDPVHGHAEGAGIVDRHPPSQMDVHLRLVLLNRHLAQQDVGHETVRSLSSRHPRERVEPEGRHEDVRIVCVHLIMIILDALEEVVRQNDGKS